MIEGENIPKTKGPQELFTNNSDTNNAGKDEFERQPVPKHSLLGFKSFIGMYAGEHTAGTELMIGPLFVAGR